MSARTEETYKDHLERVVARCGSQWMVLKTDTLLGEEYLLTPRLCKSNYCTTCRSLNLQRLRRSLYVSLKKRSWRLVTLTYPDHSVDKLDQLKATSRQFKLLVQRLKRRYPRLAFVRTIELHESDFPHIHMIVDHYITKSLLAKAWNDLGGGIVDIAAHRRCHVCGVRGKCQHNPKPPRLSYREAADYLTDEIEKANQDPHTLGLTYWLAHLRSITTSRNFKITHAMNEWKYVGVWNEPTEAYDYVTRLHDLSPPGSKPALSIIDGKNALIIGYGFPEGI